MDDDFLDNDEIIDYIILEEPDETGENEKGEDGHNLSCLGLVLFLPAVIFLFQKIC